MIHVTVRLVTDMSCGNVCQYQLKSNLGVCLYVWARELFHNISISQFYRILFHDEHPPGNFESKWLVVYLKTSAFWKFKHKK